MPELPDITLYVEHLRRLVAGRTLERVRVLGPNLLRTAEPPLSAAHGRAITGVRRMGKRIVLATDSGPRLVLHLMVAGRLHWRTPGAKLAGRSALAALDFAHGTLTWTEASTRQRASLHVAADDAAVDALDPGGLEPLECDAAAFAARLRAEDHTLKRALTDPHLFSGIGNAFSDEILHAARMSPFKRTSQTTDDEAARLHGAVREVLATWTERLREQCGEKFPEKVTAFREGFAVHGRYRQPCPVCGAPVQRVRYVENEMNYCARCQLGGRLLADRSLSRLLKSDWPRTLEELEERRRGGPPGSA